MPFDMRALVQIHAAVHGPTIEVELLRAGEADYDASGNIVEGTGEYAAVALSKAAVVWRVPLAQRTDTGTVGRREADQLRVWVQSPDTLRTTVTTGAADERLPPDRVRVISPGKDLGKVYQLTPAGDHSEGALVQTGIAVLIDDDVGVVP